MSLAGSLLAFGTSWLLHLPLALLLGGLVWAACRLLATTRLGPALPTTVYVCAFLLAAWLGLRALAPGITAGSRVAMHVEQVDLAPTLLELAGVAPRPGSMDGRSLVSLLTGGSLPEVPVFTMNLERQSRFSRPTDGSAAILYRGWKFTHHWGRHAGMSGLSDSLTDIEADWLETENRLAEDPARADALKAMLLAERQRHFRQ